MAAGLPVIATNGGGPKEIIEDGISGILIPPNDAVAFASRLEELIGKPELRKNLGTAGRKRVEERFSRETFNRRVFAAMASLLT